MNILGFNIGQNYKGILNIGSTINSPLSGTLQAVTDGMGNASPLQLSTTQVAVLGPVQTGTGSLYKPFVVNYSNSTISVTGGEALSVGVTASGASRYSVALRLGAGSDTQTHYIYGGDNSVQGFAVSRQHSSVYAFGTGLYVGGAFPDVAPSARLHVRGDGTNPIGRFEDNAGSPMLRIENSLMRFGSSTPFGSLAYAMTGTTFSGNNNGTGLGFYSQNSIAGTTDRFDFGFSGDAVANTAGIVSHLALVRTFAAGAGSSNFRPLNLAYTINNSGAQTGTATGIFLNATETALNGMTHNLMDLQVGGSSRFRVQNNGAISNTAGASGSPAMMVNRDSLLNAVYGVGEFAGNPYGSACLAINANSSYFEFWSSNTMRFRFGNSSGNSLVQFGGTTNAFPALKRNGAALEVRLADDSGFANLNTAQIFGYTAGGSPAVRFKLGEISGGQGISTREGQFAVGFTDASQNSGFRFLAAGSGTTYFDGWSEGTTKALNYRMVFGSRVNNTGVNTTGATTAENGTPCIFGFDSHDASAIVQINSTTRGFLPPTGTNAQMLAIATPATGLVFYDTTNNKLNVYDGTNWVAMH